MKNEFIKILEQDYIKQDKPHCVFVSIVAKDTKPFKDYQPAKKLRANNLVVPMTLMQMRWDNLIGFPGGKVDLEDYINGQVSEEVLKNALIREMVEEINIEENTIDKSRLEHLCTYTDGDNYIHNFSYYVDFEELKKIIKRSIEAEHYLAENGGSFVFHLYPYSEDKGLVNVDKHKFCATALIELKELILKLGLTK